MNKIYVTEDEIHKIESHANFDTVNPKLQVTCEASTSSIMPSSQIALYEERLEDMRQELVRQYQEHQHATEMLRQGHMQQMEWQKENQEQLLAELERLKIQLAEVMWTLSQGRDLSFSFLLAFYNFFLYIQTDAKMIPFSFV